MKTLITSITFLAIATCSVWAQSNVYYSNNVIRAEAVRAASQLRTGMWEEQASTQLATNGLKYAIGVGAITGWNRCYGLSDESSLVLDYSARSIATNGFWGGNGILQRAWIESNSVVVTRIALTNAP